MRVHGDSGSKANKRKEEKEGKEVKSKRKSLRGSMVSDCIGKEKKEECEEGKKIVMIRATKIEIFM